MIGISGRAATSLPKASNTSASNATVGTPAAATRPSPVVLHHAPRAATKTRKSAITTPDVRNTQSAPPNSAAQNSPAHNSTTHNSTAHVSESSHRLYHPNTASAIIAANAANSATIATTAHAPRTHPSSANLHTHSSSLDLGVPSAVAARARPAFDARQYTQMDDNVGVPKLKDSHAAKSTTGTVPAACVYTGTSLSAASSSCRGSDRKTAFDLQSRRTTYTPHPTGTTSATRYATQHTTRRSVHAARGSYTAATPAPNTSTEHRADRKPRHHQPQQRAAVQRLACSSTDGMTTDTIGPGLTELAKSFSTSNGSEGHRADGDVHLGQWGWTQWRLCLELHQACFNGAADIRNDSTASVLPTDIEQVFIQKAFDATINTAATAGYHATYARRISHCVGEYVEARREGSVSPCGILQTYALHVDAATHMGKTDASEAYASALHAIALGLWGHADGAITEGLHTILVQYSFMCADMANDSRPRTEPDLEDVSAFANVWRTMKRCEITVDVDWSMLACNMLNRSGVDMDFCLFVLAQIMRRPIIVIPSRGASGATSRVRPRDSDASGAIYLPMTRQPHECARSPIPILQQSGTFSPLVTFETDEQQWCIPITTFLGSAFRVPFCKPFASKRTFAVEMQDFFNLHTGSLMMIALVTNSEVGGLCAFRNLVRHIVFSFFFFFGGGDLFCDSGRIGVAHRNNSKVCVFLHAASCQHRFRSRHISTNNGAALLLQCEDWAMVTRTSECGTLHAFCRVPGHRRTTEHPHMLAYLHWVVMAGPVWTPLPPSSVRPL